MENGVNSNQTGTQSQGNIHIAELRRWMYLNNITYRALARVCGVTPHAVMASVRGDRMPVRHYRAITEAYPDLPVKYLPEPRNVPSGPRPKCLDLQEAGA